MKLVETRCDTKTQLFIAEPAVELAAPAGTYRVDPVNGSALVTAADSPAAPDEPGTYLDPPNMITHCNIL